MAGSKVVSGVLAAVLVGCCCVSVVFARQLRASIRDAESRCKELDSRCRLLESKRDELARQLTDARSLVQVHPDSGDDDAVSRLKEALEFKEMELTDLSKAYDSLRAEYDALLARAANMPGAELPPEALEMLNRARERFGARAFSPEARDQRREEFVQTAVAALQERIDKAPNQSIQQNLMQIEGRVKALSELRRQLGETTDEDERRDIGLALRDEVRDLQRMVQEERNLELAYVAGQFGIDDPESVQRFVRAIETVNNNPAQRLLQPFGMAFGGTRFWDRGARRPQ